MITEIITLNEERNVTLTAFLQKVGGEFPNITKRPAILVLPGGGYSMCSEREADPVALTYLQAGFQAFVLRYSVKEHAVWPNPLNDYEQAIELIRSKAEEWNLYPDKVAVIGFSAGGHLAAAAATLAKIKPNAVILGYPVTEGETARGCEATAPDLVSAVDRKTSPCFLFATRTDNLVPISNTINFTAALAKCGVSFESHIYAYGPHGFSTGNSSVMMPGTNICGRAASWVADSIGWLKDVLGDFGIHPKEKKPVGHRLALLARKYVYGEHSLLADAPRAVEAERTGDMLSIRFSSGDGLYLAARDFDSYNGFELSDIYTDLIPPVLGGVCGLEVTADGRKISEAECSVEHDRLQIRSDELRNARSVQIRFAQTPFYQVNLYNSEENPALPFELII